MPTVSHGLTMLRPLPPLDSRTTDSTTETAPPSPPSIHRAWTLLPVGLLVLPILVAWIQFECHVEQVWMFPILTVLGGLAVGLMLGSRTRWLGPAVGALLIGLPLGIAGVWLPASHFHTHLTSVKVLSPDDGMNTLPGEPAPGLFEVFSYSLPPMPELELPSSTAEPMDFKVETFEVGDKLASGEWEFRDGQYYARQPDGTMEPVQFSTAQDIVADLERSFESTEDRMREAKARRFRRYHARLRELRGSGRLLNNHRAE